MQRFGNPECEDPGERARAQQPGLAAAAAASASQQPRDPAPAPGPAQVGGNGPLALDPLTAQLRRLYGAIVEEPVPESILALLKRLKG